MGRFETAQTHLAEHIGNQTTNAEKVAQVIEKQLQGIDERTEKYEKKLDRSIDLQVASLSEGIRHLNEVLRELNGKQIVVQKKSWFSKG
jgi:hypothetical protein